MHARLRHGQSGRAGHSGVRRRRLEDVLRRAHGRDARRRPEGGADTADAVGRRARRGRAVVSRRTGRRTDGKLERVAAVLPDKLQVVKLGGVRRVNHGLQDGRLQGVHGRGLEVTGNVTVADQGGLLRCGQAEREELLRVGRAGRARATVTVSVDRALERRLREVRHNREELTREVVAARGSVARAAGPEADRDREVDEDVRLREAERDNVALSVRLVLKERTALAASRARLAHGGGVTVRRAVSIRVAARLAGQRETSGSAGGGDLVTARLRLARLVHLSAARDVRTVRLLQELDVADEAVVRARSVTAERVRALVSQVTAHKLGGGGLLQVVGVAGERGVGARGVAAQGVRAVRLVRTAADLTSQRLLVEASRARPPLVRAQHVAALVVGAAGRNLVHADRRSSRGLLRPADSAREVRVRALGVAAQVVRARLVRARALQLSGVRLLLEVGAAAESGVRAQGVAALLRGAVTGGDSAHDVGLARLVLPASSLRACLQRAHRVAALALRARSAGEARAPDSGRGRSDLQLVVRRACSNVGVDTGGLATGRDRAVGGRRVSRAQRAAAPRQGASSTGGSARVRAVRSAAVGLVAHTSGTRRARTDRLENGVSEASGAREGTARRLAARSVVVARGAVTLLGLPGGFRLLRVSRVAHLPRDRVARVLAAQRGGAATEDRAVHVVRGGNGEHERSRASAEPSTRVRAALGNGAVATVHTGAGAAFVGVNVILVGAAPAGVLARARLHAALRLASAEAGVRVRANQGVRQRGRAVPVVRRIARVVRSVLARLHAAGLKLGGRDAAVVGAAVLGNSRSHPVVSHRALARRSESRARSVAALSLGAILEGRTADRGSSLRLRRGRADVDGAVTARGLAADTIVAVAGLASLAHHGGGVGTPGVAGRAGKPITGLPGFAARVLAGRQEARKCLAVAERRGGVLLDGCRRALEVAVAAERVAANGVGASGSRTVYGRDGNGLRLEAGAASVASARRRLGHGSHCQNQQPPCQHNGRLAFL
eukprot:Rhum_TRINITY_DN14946_c3_g1::Rhum_TRINITY_DN14946_c3_g1_i1::g.132373::m.132373